MNKDEADRKLNNLIRKGLTREQVRARFKRAEAEAAQDEKRMNALLGAGCVSFLVAAGALALAWGLTGSVLIGVGVAALVFVAALLYLFGVAIGA